MPSIKSELFLQQTTFLFANYSFAVLTEDDVILVCAFASQKDKAIHSTQNNSNIGEYIRLQPGVEWCAC